MLGLDDHLPTELCDVSTKLNAHGISSTTQRLEIAQLLLSEHQHFSADGLLGLLRSSGVNVSKATVYNTLGLFVERGIVRQVIVDPTKVFYDSNVAPHQHFYNVDDGVLIDVHDNHIAIASLPIAPPGTIIDGVDVVIRLRNSQDTHNP